MTEPARATFPEAAASLEPVPSPEPTVSVETPSPETPSPATLAARLDACMSADAVRLRRRLQALRRRGRGADARQWSKLDAAIDASAARRAARAASAPEAGVVPDLPIAAKAEAIARAVADHPVTLVVGATGSGKSTQLPKICLGAGRGIGATIGHTQPRRIAARSVAARVAAELGTDLGRLVGYQVRFGRQVAPDTLVKLMTDGILLAEIQRDRDLRAYDTLIIDEAHERTLNVDFVLGYLRTLLRRRPELRVVVASATLEVEKLRTFFDGAPVIEVEGRTFPVEIRYRPGTEGEDVPDKVAGALAEIRDEPGDVLVFLSGEREIRETEARLGGMGLADTELFPLHARMSVERQQALFAPCGRRRVVLATNVAETSLTVPGVRFVIDAGAARVSRYAHRTGVQRLPVEPIARASAEQRAGRCGRIGPGVCIRLYDEADFAARPTHAEPEIRRSDLAAVLLRMLSLGLHDVDRFPFIDPPDRRHVNDGLRLLRELGAVDGGGLTKLGRLLARFPLDPRIGRMLLEADALGCVAEVLVIASFLSVPDPRERRPESRSGRRRESRAGGRPPAPSASATGEGVSSSTAPTIGKGVPAPPAPVPGGRAPMSSAPATGGGVPAPSALVVGAARAGPSPSTPVVRTARTAPPASARAGFGDPRSDFLGIVDLWRRFRSAVDEPGGSARGFCRRHSLSPARMRDWADVHGQIREICRELGIRPRGLGTASPGRIHRALLAGLLRCVGARTPEGEYAGLRGTTFRLAPGSALHPAVAPWIVAAEVVETGRPYAFMAGRIRAEWVEKAAGDLVRRSHFDAHWDARRAEPMVFEQVALYGLTLIARRQVRYAPVSREDAREVFLRSGLVENGYACGHAFAERNARVLARLRAVEHKLRSPGALVGDDAVFAFYDARVPRHVVDGRSFEEWWSGLGEDGARGLELRPEDVVAPGASLPSEAAFPDVLRVGDQAFDLAYRFAPGEDDDGLTVTIPRDALADLDPGRFEWLVPGMLEEKTLALLRALPKSLRRSVMPLGEVAREFVAGTDAAGTDATGTDAAGAGVAGTSSAGAGAAGRRFGDGSLRGALARFLDHSRGVHVPPDAWSPERLRRVLPAHLHMRFEIVMRDGTVLGRSRRFEALERRSAERSGQAGWTLPASGGPTHVAWTFGAVPAEAEDRSGGGFGTVFPALRDVGTGVVVEHFQARGAAEHSHRGGLVRLFSLAMRHDSRGSLRRLPGIDELCLLYAMIAPAPGWVETPPAHAGRPAAGTYAEARFDLVERTVAKVFVARAGGIREAKRFGEVLAAGRSAFAGALEATAGAALSILRAARAVRQLADAPDLHAPPASLADVQRQLDGLVHHGFLATTPDEAFASLPRYLEALRMRLGKLRRGGADDERRLAGVLPLQQRLESKARDVRARGRRAPELARHRWMLEEYRVSVFAQELGTAFRVSRKRLDEQWSRIAAL